MKMKKLLSLLMAAILMITALPLSSVAAFADGETAYAVFDGVDTLTFRYDDAMPDENAWDVSNTEGGQPWGDYTESITTVVFDDSFAAARPQNTACWFIECSNLETISAIENLNTSSVTNMGDMFNACRSLSSLDVSNFDTTSVLDMSFMFCDCNIVSSLDVSNFVTSNVENMRAMFYGCNCLTSLDLSSFNTAKVWDLNGMFCDCNSLVSLDLSSFNTSKVEDMTWMFSECNSLTSLDLSSFDAPKLWGTYQMFYNCSSLERIWVADDSVYWTSNSDEFDDTDMFLGCESLSGNISGKTYDENDVDSTWANVETGYFSVKQEAEMQAYAVFDGVDTLTFRYDDEMPSENAWDVSDTEGFQPWEAYQGSITTVVFDDSFAAARPQCTALWFDGLCNLETIEAIENLNTSAVTDMESMFNGCSTLTTLDVSHFDTSSVDSMFCMFGDCSGLTTLDVSNFDTSNVVYTGGMFAGCSGLTTLDLSSFDTANVSDANNMFVDCTGLQSIDLSSFDTSSIGNMTEMFENCTSLKTLDLSSFDTTSLYEADAMFNGCTSLRRIWVADETVDWTVVDYYSFFDGTDMFYDCEKLYGNISKKPYNENAADKMWANVQTGYFSVKPLEPNDQVSLSIGAEIVSNYYIDVDYYADVEGATTIRYRYNEDSENADYVLSAWQEYAIDELDERSEEAGVEGDYVFHVRQAPAQITEEVTVELLDEDGETVDTLTFSAINYCLAMQEDDNYGDLATAMMLYCFASQQYFTDYMQKEGTVDLVAYTGKDADYYKEMLNDFYEPYGDAAEKTLQLAQSSDVQFTGMSYVCAPTSRLRLYINGYEEGKDLGDISLSTPSGWKSSTGGLLATKGDGKYFIQVSDINAIDFDKPFTLSFGGATVTCSVTDYALLCVNSDETGTSGYLGKALILYNGKVKEAANRA